MKQKILLRLIIPLIFAGSGIIIITFLFSYPLGFGEDSTISPLTGQGGISFEEDKELATGPPGNVQLIKDQGVNVIQWEGPPVILELVSIYVVYRRCNNDWVRIGRVQAEKGENRGNYTWYSFTDENIETCEYAVSAISPLGKESQKEIAK